MEAEEPILRLKSLHRDLIAFADNELANIERLTTELDASIADLRTVFDKNKRNDESRKKLAPAQSSQLLTVRIEDVQYQINEDFRQAALMVADELDLDELDSVGLCIATAHYDLSQTDTSLPYRALLHFHDVRLATLDSLRLLLQQGVDAEDEDNHSKFCRQRIELVVAQSSDGRPASSSAYWRKCVDGLGEIESSLKKVSDHKQTYSMTGQDITGDLAEALEAQRVIMTQQHESLATSLSYLIQGGYAKQEDFRALLSKAAAADATLEIVVHYVPILISGSACFGSDASTEPETAHALNSLYAAGPGQLQWKHSELKAVATTVWLAEYSSRFANTLEDPALRVADRQRAEGERTQLLLESLRSKALRFVLAACSYLKPEAWHDPAKVGLVRFLLGDSPYISTDAPPATDEFANFTMRELQVFVDAFVTNLPDILRRMKHDEDDRRRNWINGINAVSQYEPDLERFMVVMSYAYQGDPDAARDFWFDKGSNLHGFLEWLSKRLPTPRVAAFCELLRSIASDVSNADNAHRFLLEDPTLAELRPRRSSNVSWSQIFLELDTFACAVKDKPATSQLVQNGQFDEMALVEPETPIMLEAYLRLASHICRASPAARNWLLREQSFHLGETMLELASSATLERIRASCFNMLSAMLTDKVPEVNDGMWAMIDQWISAGGPATLNAPRFWPNLNERHYLLPYNKSAETAAAFAGLLAQMVTLPASQDQMLDVLPFPENLGAPHRRAGIEYYVDFILGVIFKSWASPSFVADVDPGQLDVLRFACVDFAVRCLATFNEDLPVIANLTGLAVDSTIKTSTLAVYMRLHPFARVMDWMFHDQIIDALFYTIHRNVDELNGLRLRTPAVQATLKTLQLMNLTLKLQSTWFDIVRPIIKAQSTNHSPPVANPALTSFNEAMLDHLQVVVDTVSLCACTHVDISLESFGLLRKLVSSRMFSGASGGKHGAETLGSRLLTALAGGIDAIATQLIPDFQIFEWDIETRDVPPKLIKAKATLDLLNDFLEVSVRQPTLAHLLLGFGCRNRSVYVADDGMFAIAKSLFHAIAATAAQMPVAVSPTYLSWLLSVKSGALTVLSTLTLSPLTSSLVTAELRSMDFLIALSKNQILNTDSTLWDGQTISSPALLLGEPADAVRDFLHAREIFFELAALELRAVESSRTYSVQNKIVSALLGKITLPTGDQEPTYSVFELVDFLEIETAPASEATTCFLLDFDFSACLVSRERTEPAYDLKMAEQLLILSKRELIASGKVKRTEEQQVDDEIHATLASLLSQNNWRAIRLARMSTLEAWADLVALMVTLDSLNPHEQTKLALQGLQIVLPRLERSLSGNINEAALLAKLAASLVPAATAEDANQQIASALLEQLLTSFRVSLKTVNDSQTDLTLRDVCYRICCSVLSSVLPRASNGEHTSSPSAKELVQLVQSAGDRLLTVVTEDAFSERGATRVSALLFIDAMFALFQGVKASAVLMRALSKLNFIPVLLDMSIASVATTFSSNVSEVLTNLAYVHTAQSVLLRICHTSEGAQVVLNSGFFAAVSDSRLFRIDPDIGLDIDNPVALGEFYKLLAAVLRIAIAIIMSRGASNEAPVQQARKFLEESRPSVQTVFKRTTSSQSNAGFLKKELEEVADGFARLMLATGFLEEDASTQMRLLSSNGFS